MCSIWSSRGSFYGKRGMPILKKFLSVKGGCPPDIQRVKVSVMGTCVTGRTRGVIGVVV